MHTTNYNNYLMHYGVKGMKWGVRHDKPSLGRRYSNWGRSVSNKRYDRASSNIEKRRQKRLNENFLRNTRYGKAVDRISNKNYDKAQKRIEERRTKKNQEFDEFDRALDRIDNKKNDIKSTVSSAKQNFEKQTKSFKMTPKQKKIAKRIAIGAAIVGGVALASYGGYKLSQTRNYNKAAVARFLDRNPGMMQSVLTNKPRHFYTSSSGRSTGAGSTNIGPRSSLSMIENAKLSKSGIKGPSLKVSRSTVERHSNLGTSAGLEKGIIGNNGNQNPIVMDKNERKYWANIYNNKYKPYARRNKR